MDLIKVRKIFGICLLLAVGASACSRVEKILPRKDGHWRNTNSRIVTFLNDSLVSDITETDSLGETFFKEDGTGFRLDHAENNTGDFLWTVNDENDHITFTDTSGSAVTVEILESSANEMTFFQSITSGTSPNVRRVETTSELERIK